MSDQIWKIITAAIICVMLFGNRKVWLWRVFKEQLLTFRNAKKNRLSPWDFICFLLFPVVVSIIMVYKLDVCIDTALAELLTTVFSIVFTVLFGFASVLISKIDSSNKTENKVVSETFVSIVSANTFSLTAAILSIILTQIINTTMIRILSTSVLSFSFIVVLLMLMITKRIFSIYIGKKSE